MEKKTPHTRLHLVQALVAEGKVRATNTAMNGADELGLTFDGMCDAIKGLKMSDFFKSMTTYKPTLACGVVYLKLTVSNGVLIVSFKEK
jgi:motility quorum-sensing regulator/GCU-specific mRNA interferase toxin